MRKNFKCQGCKRKNRIHTFNRLIVWMQICMHAIDKYYEIQISLSIQNNYTNVLNVQALGG